MGKAINKTAIVVVLTATLAVPILSSAAPNAGIKPDSPFYFFDITIEKVSLFFTFNLEKKIQKALAHAEERLTEAEAMAIANKPEAVSRAMKEYQTRISFATDRVHNAKSEDQSKKLLTTVAESTAKHQEVLTETYNRVAEEAKEAIEKAIAVSIKGHEEALKQIGALTQKVSARNEEIETLQKEVEDLKKAQAQPRTVERIVEVRPTEPPKTAKRLDSEEIYAKIAPAVVLIETSVGSGSGIVIESNGLILTNAHVIEGTNQAIVKIGGTIAIASVLGRDENVDLALLKIERTNLPVVELGDSNEVALKRGEEVFAFGYPLGFKGDVTATRGIISARQIVDGVIYLQTDATIHPGNSGGPLVNNLGQVIGINSLVLAARGSKETIGGTGIGFAIPVNVARGLIPELKTGKKITTSKPEVALPQQSPPGFISQQQAAWADYLKRVSKNNVDRVAGLKAYDKSDQYTDLRDYDGAIRNADEAIRLFQTAYQDSTALEKNYPTELNFSNLIKEVNEARTIYVTFLLRAAEQNKIYAHAKLTGDSDTRYGASLQRELYFTRAKTAGIDFDAKGRELNATAGAYFK
ncbi:MAG: trypsin-like peptidase domain-containing protein [Candidatus Sungbacteria bacterium]|uniref:Trypsin-like peptidase domain-containing protein n=1 Tax=Candidatus Sungiibacteriota bacterium TaxID=2750080 RepID=A0A933DS40_9BACT|nr:trypsin-like peptidase domain-containing protein [Candidatus Sungbacteria bacterium]